MTQRAALLTEGERRVLEAVCDTLIPALKAGEGDSPALFALSARDVSLAAAVEQAMSALSARQVRELRLFLRLLDTRAYMLAVAGRPIGICRMRPEQREVALLGMSRSILPAVRTGFQALKRLATFLFYAVTTDRGANPSWSAIGYELPDPAPAGASLPLRRLSGRTTLDADVCVIGSGAGGSVVAARMAARGREVVVLEAGHGDQAGDFDQREITGMQRLYLDRGTTATRDLGIALLAGSGIGGGTAVNWQTSLRLPDFIRDEWAERSGNRAFIEDAFTHAFDAVALRLSVGTAESVANANNLLLERGCASLDFRTRTIPRNARGCDLSQCGFCVFGCRVGGKQSAAVTFLRDACDTGRVTVVPACKADTIRFERGAVVGVAASARDERTGARFPVRVNARAVVVAAGAVESPALLLRSGVTHDHLGRNLFLHPTTAVAGQYDEPVRGWIGAPQSVLCDEFGQRRGNYGFRLETAPVHPGLLALAEPWYGGRDHRSKMQHASHVGAVIVLARDRASGRVSADRDGRAMIDYAPGRLERLMLQDGIAAAAMVHWAAGATEIHALHTRDHTFRRRAGGRQDDIQAYCRELVTQPVHANRCALFSAHQMGTCRMGADRHASVCDERGQVRGVPGLYVADASLFPASSGVNPMLTIMALAHMVGEAINHES